MSLQDGWRGTCRLTTWGQCRWLPPHFVQSRARGRQDGLHHAARFPGGPGSGEGSRWTARRRRRGRHDRRSVRAGLVAVLVGLCSDSACHCRLFWRIRAAGRITGAAGQTPRGLGLGQCENGQLAGRYRCRGDRRACLSSVGVGSGHRGARRRNRRRGYGDRPPGSARSENRADHGAGQPSRR